MAVPSPTGELEVKRIWYVQPATKEVHQMEEAAAALLDLDGVE
jgi:hypothetical protein